MQSDLKVLAMTWNMGQKNILAMKNSPELFFGNNVEEYDLIAVCSQECKKKFKQARLDELEQYLNSKGF